MKRKFFTFTMLGLGVLTSYNNTASFGGAISSAGLVAPTYFDCTPAVDADNSSSKYTFSKLLVGNLGSGEQNHLQLYRDEELIKSQEVFTRREMVDGQYSNILEYTRETPQGQRSVIQISGSIGDSDNFYSGIYFDESTSSEIPLVCQEFLLGF